MYDYEKTFIADITPIVCTIYGDVQAIEITSIETLKLKYLDKRKIPLPESEFMALSGLRAPPVIA